YRANDGQTNSSPATVSITVTPVNDAPVASDQCVTTPEDTSTNLVLTGSDVEGPVTFAILSAPTSGALRLLNTHTGAATYSPLTLHDAPPSSSRANNGHTNSTPATVSITVTPVNDAPVANNQNVTTPEYTATNLVLTGSDVEGPVTFAILSAPA